MKKFIALFVLSVLSSSVAFADDLMQPVKAVSSSKVKISSGSTASVQNVKRADYSLCCDTFSVSADKLFYLTLASLSKMNFNVKEVQSKTGTILFSALSKEFMVTIAGSGSGISFMKILPTDSNYSFSPSFASDIFNTVRASVSSGIVAL